MMPIRRDLRFNLPAARISDWHSHGPQVTHFFNALSVFFPVGERFFIASVRNYRGRIGTAELREAVTVFIGQEAMHGREHEAYNRLVQNSGMPVQDMEQLVDRVLDIARKLTSQSWQLATTLALEHQTAIIGDLLLSNPDLLVGSDPAFRRLWQWHALEETEHKAVAYDVWNEAVGDGNAAYLVRSASMVFTSLAFWALVAAFSIRMIETDPATRRQPLGYLDLTNFLFGKQGMFRASLPTWLGYFKRSFHPWQHDNRELLGQIDAVTSDAAVSRQSPAA
jgi:predicted metal-dependent hydrolase